MDRIHGQDRRPSPLDPMDESTRHDVRFYNEDRSLVSVVSDFLAEGIQTGQPVIVLATPAHRRAIAARLKDRGLDPEQIPAEDALWLDPHATLQTFMNGAMPDIERFKAIAETMLDHITANRPQVVVRAYGEMVDLLWRDGKCDGALALEGLWNDLAQKYRLAMLCTYSKESLIAHAPDGGVERICAAHRRVL
jgi:hypothetical protein